MSWSFGNVPSAGSGNQSSAAQELPEIQTDKIGFLAIAGDTKIRLVPRPWPADRLPPSSASLLSIAPKQGLIAAAGPDCLVVATTESVRQAYSADAPSENNVKQFTPQATLSIPRVSQVAFSADESCLAIAAEEGGGIAVYDTQGLQQGRQEPAFQLATNGLSVRALAPNPAPEASHFFALVLDQGQLLLANLKDRQMVSTANGSSVFREGVSCVSWSARGKQLVVGLQDGSAAQYDPKGDLKASIPCPASASGLPMTAIYWLANDDFLTVHTPNEGDSKIHVIHRDKASGGFTLKAFAIDPTTPMGPRTPTHHYINRLKGFPPSLDDALILSSSSGFDIGLITKSTAALSDAQVINTYALTSMSDDSRRAYMPMASDGASESSALGTAIDLSSKEIVPKPIPTNDLSDSVNPLPALMIFDIEGRLTTYWFVYTDSIIQKTPYPGLVNARGLASSASVPSAFGTNGGQASAAQMPAFGASTFGQSSKPAFGATSTPGFGGASLMGGKASPWASTQSATAAATPTPTFGSTTIFGAASATPAFGASSGIASKPSIWGSSSTQSSTPAFGQPSAPASSSGTGFAAFGSYSDGGFAAVNKSVNPTTSPFTAFGGSGNSTVSPFATAATDSTKSPSPFATAAAGSNNNTSSPLATASPPSNSTASLFAAAANSGTGQTFASFGQASTPATSSSIFGAAKPAFGTPSAPTSIFGSKPNSDQQAPFSPEANMEDDDQGTTPAAKPSSTSLFGADNFKVGSIFAQNRDAKTASQNEAPKPEKTPAKSESSSLFGANFGAALGDAAAATTPATPIKEEPQSPAAGLPAVSMTPATPKATQDAEDAPLPPDFTKTPAKALAPVKSSSAPPIDDPLPPDFLSKTPKPSAEAEDAPFPPDFTAQTKSNKLSKSAELPLAGSPPVDLGPESPDFHGSQDEAHSEESEMWEDEDLPEDDDEHEDEEVDDDDEEADEDDDTALQDDESSTPAGAKTGLSAPSSYSKTPAGLPKGPIFAPPIKESPRSPSPVREMQPPPARPQTRKIVLPVEKYPRKTSSLSESQRPVIKEPQTADLQDDEDERIKAILKAPIEPVKTLESFVAHQDYIGSDEKQGLEGQIENVYRDINSMVDTLGLNARTLQAFVQGQETLNKKSGRGRADLGEEDEWCFVELDDLDKLEAGIMNDLEAGRIADVKDKTGTIGGMQYELARLKSRMAEMRKQLAARTDPDRRAAQRNATMDAETEARQSQIRGVVQTVQRLLQDTEDALSVLRADLASIPSSDSVLAGGSRRAVPTVEAVTKTILKMTAMVESKSGDVDVLEAQMRRLHRGLADLSLDDGGRDGDAATAAGVGGGGDSIGLLRSSLSLRTSTSTLRRSVRGGGGLPSSRSMNALPTPRGIRMTATGDRTGMAGMFGSRYGSGTPPQSALGKSMSVMSFASPASGSGLSFGGGMGQSLLSAVSRSTLLGTADHGDHGLGRDVVAFHVRRQHRRTVLDALKGVVERKGSRVVRVEKSIIG